MVVRMARHIVFLINKGGFIPSTLSKRYLGRELFNLKQYQPGQSDFYFQFYSNPCTQIIKNTLILCLIKNFTELLYVIHLTCFITLNVLL